MSQIYISIGSNIDRHQNISNALNDLEQLFGPLLISSVYESEAVGFAGDNFFNLVVGAQTQLAVADVVVQLKLIEQRNGRVQRQEKFSARTLDLDLLTYDQLIAEQPAQIPRDEITKNAFVLWPLAQIAPLECLPGSQLSYQQLWENYDQTKQKLWPIVFNRI